MVEEIINESMVGSPNFREELLDKRNVNWAKKINSFMKGDRDKMVIVGAAHLVGEKGLVKLLRDAGLKVQRWNAQKKKTPQKSAEKDVFAVDMALELRIMGGSDVLMAPQYGNKHGTLSIEPVSTRIVHKEIWEDFKEELAKVWMSYKDFDGSLLLSRVHWAKESPRSVTIDEVGFL